MGDPITPGEKPSWHQEIESLPDYLLRSHALLIRGHMASLEERISKMALETNGLRAEYEGRLQKTRLTNSSQVQRLNKQIQDLEYRTAAETSKRLEAEKSLESLRVLCGKAKNRIAELREEREALQLQLEAERRELQVLRQLKTQPTEDPAAFYTDFMLMQPPEMFMGTAPDLVDHPTV